MAYLRVSLSDEWDPGERPRAVDVTTRDGETLRYLPKRTCRNVSCDPLGFRCSECGAEDYMDGGATVWVDGGPQDASYCPHCGCKVVSDDDR